MFVDRIKEIASQHPEADALVAPGRRLTYGALVGIVEAQAEVLRTLPDNGGVTGLSIRDEVDNLVASLALIAAGRRQITLATFDPPAANLKLAASAGVDLVLCDDAGLAPAGIASVTWPAKGHTANPTVHAGLGSVLLKTSGSTGDGKLIEFDEAQLASHLRDVGHYAGRRYFRLSSVEHGICLRQRLLCLYAGGTNVFRAPEETDLARARAALEFDIIELSLMHAEDLIRRPDRSAFADVTVRMTGSAVSYRMRRQLQERVSRDLWVRYGASECGTVSMAGPDEHDSDEVAGRPSADVTVEILDTSGRPVAPGERGQIRIRTPGMAAGYLNAPGETRKRFVDGWFVPGDIAWMRADGQLVIAGRGDDMMILNGMNIFPQEIERALELHPAVRAAAALSIGSPVHGQIPVAAVQLEAGATVEMTELLAYAKEKLGLRAPRRIIVVPALPRASDGKIHHRSLLGSFQLPN